MKEQTSYEKLRPPEPTPEDELCCCEGRPPLKLMSALSANPIHCMRCNLEVPPDTLGLSQAVVEEVASWNGVYHAIYILWLDSGAYEDWAKEQMVAINSAVNIQGRHVQSMLNQTQRCYYWYFQDQSVDEYEPLRYCPLCGDALLDYLTKVFLQRVCERDSLIMAGE